MKTSYPVPAGIFEIAMLGFFVIACIFSTSVMGLLDRMDFDQFFNLGEGLLWLGIAGFIFFRTARAQRPRWLGYSAAISFALFGLSDLLEIWTRAWYSPWPLLALKAACAVSFVSHIFLY